MFQYFVADADVSLQHRMFASFSPIVAMTQTMTVLAKFEQSQVGSTAENLFSEYNNFTVGHGLIMLVIDNMWIFLLGLYLEQVTPKKFGRRQNPCFCLSCKYWGCCGTKKSSQTYESKVQLEPVDDLDPIGMLSGSADNSQSEMIKTPGKTPNGRSMFTPTPEPTPTPGRVHDNVDQTQAFETQNMNIDCYEKLTPEVDDKEASDQLLKVSGLKKVFDNGVKAVDGINVKMYTDQIFCLLGHNGAGKTTTVSMLSGLIENSEGAAELFGSSLLGKGKKMEEARKVMGVCP